jgi:hypothetical protein
MLALVSVVVGDAGEKGAKGVVQSFSECHLQDHTTMYKEILISPILEH